MNVEIEKRGSKWSKMYKWNVKWEIERKNWVCESGEKVGRETKKEVERQSGIKKEKTK